MAVLLLAEVNNGVLSMDATAKPSRLPRLWVM